MHRNWHRSTIVLLVALAGCRAAGPSVSAPAVASFKPANIRLPLVKDHPASRRLVVVKYKSGLKAADRAAFRKRNKLELFDDLYGLNAETLRLPKGKTLDSAILATLNSDPAVQYAEANMHLDISNRDQSVPSGEPPVFRDHDPVTVNDPMFNRQWALRRLEVTRAWNFTQGDPGVIVAVMDTGADITHPDLVNQVVPGFNPIFEDSDVTDDSNHGTSTAGVIAAQANNGIGTSGVAPLCKIMPLKIYWDKRTLKGGDGTGDDDWKEGTWDETNTCSDAAEAMVWAVDHGARVICADFGYALKEQDAMKIMLDGVRYALDHDVSIVAAMHNYGNAGNPVHYPAGFAGVIGIGATDGYDERFNWSGYGYHLSVMAPGWNVLAPAVTYPPFFSPATPLNYLPFSGTSTATPLVAGVVALIRSHHPELKQAEVKKVLESTAHDLGETGYDQFYGWGLVDAYRAVR